MDAHTPDREKTHWFAVFLLLVAGLFSAAQFGKLTLTLDSLGLVYGPAAPFLVSIVGVIGIAFATIAGGWIVRRGLVGVLLCALVAGAGLSLMQALLPALPIMVGLRLAEGFSHLAIVIIGPTLMASLANDRDRPVVMGIWASFFGVALAIMALILPGIMAIGGLPAVMIAHGLGMAAIAVILWRVLTPVPADLSPQPGYFAVHKTIYGTPRRVIAGAGFVFYTTQPIALVAVLPGALDLSPAMTSALPLVSLIGTFGAGFAARRFAPTHLSILGFALTILATLGLALAPSGLMAMVMFLVGGIVPGACFATIPYFNATVPDRARAMGAMAQLGNVGTTIGTPIYVAVLVWGGMTALAATTIAFCIGGITTIALLSRKIK